MLLRILSISSLALIFAACHESAPPRSPHPIVTSWPVDPTNGVATLAITYAPEFKTGTFRVVTTPEQLHETWSYFGFREPLPDVDFREREVVVFVEGDVCGDRGRGRGGGPVLGAWLLDDGSVLPLFEEHSQLACEDALERARTGFAYALSVPRVTSPRISRVLTGKRPELSGASLPTDVSQQSGSPPTPANQLGQATLVARTDGTPVWVVRHPDGSSSALGADYELMPALLPGLRASVRFSARSGRFTGPFDEWGTHLSGTQPGLMRYTVFLRDGRAEIGEPIGLVPAGRPRLHTKESYSVESSSSAPGPFDAIPHRSVREALRMPAGTLSIVNARVQLQSNANAVLCAGDVSGAEDCVTVRDVRSPSGCSGTLGGDFALRTDSADAVSHLVALEFNCDYACRTSEGVRPYFPPRGTWGQAPLSGTVSFAAFGGFSGPELQLGAELSAALRVRHSPATPRSFARAQLGDVFELALRAHWFDEPRQHGTPAWALGVAPSLTALSGHWSMPTLIGVAMPEIGIISQRQTHNAFFAWRFPIEYRAHPMRQHPYLPEERVAWFAAPEFLLTLGDSPQRWRAGVAGGFSIW